MNQTLKISVGLAKSGVNHIIKGNRIIVQGSKRTSYLIVNREEKPPKVVKKYTPSGWVYKEYNQGPGSVRELCDVGPNRF